MFFHVFVQLLHAANVSMASGQNRYNFVVDVVVKYVTSFTVKAKIAITHVVVAFAMTRTIF